MSLAVLAAIIMCACASSPPPESGVPSNSLVTPELSSGPCRAAPTWLVAATSARIRERGATLSNVYIGPASNFTEWPDPLSTEAWADAWWVVGWISGIGIQPEVASWVTNRTGPATKGDIFAVDAPASRYSSWDSQLIKGDGLAEVRACVPEPPRS
jgi:hypothetical protein